MPHIQLSNPSKKMCYWKNSKIFNVFNFFPSQIWRLIKNQSEGKMRAFQSSPPSLITLWIGYGAIMALME
jgi:hypothetical protein